MDLNNCERERRLSKMRCALSMLKENVAKIEKSLNVINKKILNRKIEMEVKNPQKIIKETNEKLKRLDNYKKFLDKSKDKPQEVAAKEKPIRKKTRKDCDREFSLLNLVSTRTHYDFDEGKATNPESLNQETEEDLNDVMGRKAGGMIENWDSLERLNDWNTNDGPLISSPSFPKIDASKYKTVMKYINSMDSSFDALSLDRISNNNCDLSRECKSVQSVDLSVENQKSVDGVNAVVEEKKQTIKPMTKPVTQKSLDKKTKPVSKENKDLKSQTQSNPCNAKLKPKVENPVNPSNKGGPLKKQPDKNIKTNTFKSQAKPTKTIEPLTKVKNGKNQGLASKPCNITRPQTVCKGPKEAKKTINIKTSTTNEPQTKQKKDILKDSTTNIYNRRNTSLNSNIKTFNAFTSTKYNQNFNNFSSHPLAIAAIDPSVMKPKTSKDPVVYKRTYAGNQSVASSTSSIHIKNLSDSETESTISNDDFLTSCKSSRLLQSKLLCPKSLDEEQPFSDWSSSSSGSSLDLNSSLTSLPKAKETSEAEKAVSLIKQAEKILQSCRKARLSDLSESARVPKNSRSSNILRDSIESLNENLNMTKTKADGKKEVSGRDSPLDEVGDLKFVDSGESCISPSSSSSLWLKNDLKTDAVFDDKKINKMLEAFNEASHLEDLDGPWERNSFFSLTEKSCSSGSIGSLNAKMVVTQSGVEHIPPNQNQPLDNENHFPIAPEDEAESLRRQMEDFRRSYISYTEEAPGAATVGEKPVLNQQVGNEIPPCSENELPKFTKDRTAEFFEWLNSDQRMSFAEYKRLKEKSVATAYQTQQPQKPSTPPPPLPPPPVTHHQEEDSYKSAKSHQGLKTPSFSFITNKKAIANLRLMLSDKKEKLELARLKALKLQTTDHKQPELPLKSSDSLELRIHDSTVSLVDPPSLSPQETILPTDSPYSTKIKTKPTDKVELKLTPESKKPQTSDLINRGFFPPQPLFPTTENQKLIEAHKTPLYSSHADSMPKRKGEPVYSPKKKEGFKELSREPKTLSTEEEFNNFEHLNNSKFLQFQHHFSAEFYKAQGLPKDGAPSSKARASPILVFKEETCTVSRTSALKESQHSAKTIDNTTKVICEHLSVNKKETTAYVSPVHPPSPQTKPAKGTPSSGSDRAKTRMQSARADLIASSYYKKKYNIYQQLVVPQNSQASSRNITPQPSAGSLHKNKPLPKTNIPMKKPINTTNNSETNKTTNDRTEAPPPLLSEMNLHGFLINPNEKKRSNWAPPSFGITSITMRPLHSNKNLICVDKPLSYQKKTGSLLKPSLQKIPSKPVEPPAPSNDLSQNCNSMSKTTTNRSANHKSMSTNEAKTTKTPIFNPYANKNSNRPYPSFSPANHRNTSKISSNNNNNNATKSGNKKPENIRFFTKDLLDTKFTNRPSISPQVISCHRSSDPAPAVDPFFPNSKPSPTTRPLN